MRRNAILTVLLVATALSALPSALAQPYCARYDEGSRECGIPTLQACEQSLRGLNGVCEPDVTAQLRPDFLPRLLPPPPGALPPPPDPNNPNNPNWMPPPPGQ
jgi:hypothetical protein